MEMSFKSVVCAVSEQCQEVKQAMSLFPYFETWDAKVVAECCRVSSPAEFPPDEIILGPGIGDAQAVHFIVKGTCRMVHHLQVEVITNSRGEITHKLRKDLDPRASDSESKDEGYLSRLFNRKGLRGQDDGEEAENGRPEKVLKGDEMNGTKPDEVLEQREEEGESCNKRQRSGKEKETECIDQKKGNWEESKQGQFAVGNGGEASDTKRKIIFECEDHVKVLRECRKRREDAICVLEKKPTGEKAEKAKSLFIESGILLSGACFGLGKIGKENFVMSLTSVKVLKIPLRFLLQHNPCNIWNRISLFHSLYMFKDDKILEYFQNGRRWAERKKGQTEEIVYSKKIQNDTSVADVPYWIRLSSTR